MNNKLISAIILFFSKACCIFFNELNLFLFIILEMMVDKKFKKNDTSFICANCGEFVSTLNYSSRDHCNKCLCSLHVDINPGDRQNECKGLLIPIGVDYNAKKGYVIQYKCEKCGQLHNNKSAEDDSFKTILSVMNGTYSNKQLK